MEFITIKGINIGEGIPKITVPICGRTKEEILQKASTLDLEKIDIVEWRIDFYEDVFDIKEVLETLRELRLIILNRLIIFTFRRRIEGGEKEISIEYYLDLNRQVSQSGNVDIVDIEVSIGENIGKSIIKEIQKSNVHVIASNHNFLKTPNKEDMIGIIKKMDEIGADIFKLAVMPRSNQDVIDLLLITHEMKGYTKKPIVTMSMGELGIISRISGGLFGSSITFGSSGESSAPGQLPVEELYNILRLLIKL